MAAIYFSKKKCTWAVFETGIGGLSDSTNALNTDLSAITSISKDHTQILGSTLAEIAYQKAGIIKKNTPVILGEIKGKALDVIKKTAIDKNAPFFCFKKDFDIKKIRLSLKGSEFIFTPEDRKIFCPKAGKSSAINAAIAFFGAKLFNKKINPVFKLNRYMLAARFDIACKKYPLILDGAHNISAAENLIANLKGLTSKKKFHFLIGFLSDKDFRGFIEVIKPYVKTVSVAKIKSPSDASKEVYSYLKSLGFAPEYFEKPSDFAKNIKNLKKGTPVVITGSFYLCSDIYKNIKSFKKAL
jgi:dihydrofolate synthase/folylpolyglutamate synthase